MQSFRFRLQRVLELRESEAKKEEAELERLYAVRVRMERERDELIASVDRMSMAAVGQQYLDPSQLVALDRYKEFAKKELQFMANRLQAHQEEIDKQMARVVASRGRVKLMEKLRDKRREEWQAGCDKELEELAADFASAQWLRTR